MHGPRQCSDNRGVRIIEVWIIEVGLYSVYMDNFKPVRNRFTWQTGLTHPRVKCFATDFTPTESAYKSVSINHLWRWLLTGF